MLVSVAEVVFVFKQWNCIMPAAVSFRFSVTLGDWDERRKLTICFAPLPEDDERASSALDTM